MTWVQDGIFAGGGEALPEGWADFAAQTGITAILHLRPDTPAVFRGPTPASFLWMAIADEGQANLEDRLLAGAFVAACLEQGQRVLLHASPGRHRARWAFVAYRVWSGASVPSILRQAAEPPWLSPYVTDRDRWMAFASEARKRRMPAHG